MLRTTLAITVLSAVFSPWAAAQQVTFTGKVENGEGVCYYCPGFDYVLDYTHTSLSSTAVNLDPFIGLYATGSGVWNGSSSAPAIDVTSLQVVPQSFSIGGNGTIGGDVKFTALGTPGDNAFIALSFGDGFLPIPGWGTLFLNPQAFFVLGQGVCGGNGEFKIKVDLPDNPALVGLKVFGQAGLATPGGATRLTNSDLKVVGA